MPRPPAKARAHHHGNLPEALVTATLECIEESGMHALTLREVARVAGVSHQAPYHHFADRASLVAAVAETGFRRLHKRLLAALERAGSDVDARLEALFVAYVRFAVDDRTLFRVMFSPEVADKSPYPSLQQSADTNLALLTNALAQAQRARRVRSGEVVDYAAAAWALAHGLANFLVDGQLRRRGYTIGHTDALARRLLGILREGIAQR
jgi:AcrR family transcriptional regulator